MPKHPLRLQASEGSLVDPHKTVHLHELSIVDVSYCVITFIIIIPKISVIKQSATVMK
jgi:hypothetical protein